MKKRLLIVDDSQSWSSFNKNLVETFFCDKFDITVANSAYEARYFAIVNSELPFDMIITDLQMENTFEDKTAGEWLIEQISQIKEYDRVKIIIISGMSNIRMIAEAFNVEYISKPQLVANNNLLQIAIEKFFPYLNKK